MLPLGSLPKQNEPLDTKYYMLTLNTYQSEELPATVKYLISQYLQFAKFYFLLE